MWGFNEHSSSSRSSSFPPSSSSSSYSYSATSPPSYSSYSSPSHRPHDFPRPAAQARPNTSSWVNPYSNTSPEARCQPSKDPLRSSGHSRRPKSSKNLAPSTTPHSSGRKHQQHPQVTTAGYSPPFLLPTAYNSSQAYQGHPGSYGSWQAPTRGQRGVNYPTRTH